ncbi:MAG: hypothetical protein EOP35_18835 [Rubrivivax sp.]|nr:MAG: hypothetical protein EOP35_18835 [Rubrivivax sp.]
MFLCRRLPSFALFLLALGGLGGCDSSGYRRSAGQWRHGDVAFTPEDPATFKPLDGRFARDARRGYFLGAMVADSDGASFAVISEHEARDRYAVYYCDTYRKGQEYWLIQHLSVARIDGADPASYTAIGRGHARDARRVYFQGRAFAARDPASFEPLDGNFGRDAQRGYYARQEIAGSDGPTFEVIADNDTAYARDRRQGYYAFADIDGEGEGETGDGDKRGAGRTPNTRVPDIVRVLRTRDVAAIRVLGRGYAADADKVWYRGRVLQGADPATFASDASYQAGLDATDRSGPWQQGRRVGAAP